MISGPSGVGKSTLVDRLRGDERVFYSVSATTRPPREGEVDGVHYRFLSDEDFEAKLAEDGFLEWAEVHGRRYGTLRAPVEAAIARGQLPLLELDVQGAFSVRDSSLAALLVFIEPPVFADLERRLRNRSTEDESAITRRISRARDEMALAPRYDRRIVNADVAAALRELVALIEAEFGVALEAEVA